MPQAATERLSILVGEDKARIILTDDAVEAVQAAAASQTAEALDEVVADHAKHIDALTFADLGDLLGLRDHLLSAAQAVDVLIECRPLSELHADDGS
jgi:hypothetical protein